jgi:GNAT superfamily N-acetyltransferase
MYYPTGNLFQPFLFHTLRGRPVAIRRVVSADTILLADLLCRLSEQTRRLRYLAPRALIGEIVWREAARMARGRTDDHLTLVVVAQGAEPAEAFGVGELVRDEQAPTTAEIAVVVRDDQQNQGLGSFLLWQLVCAAQQNGITRLYADLLEENQAMLRLIRELRLPYTATTSYGETRAIISVPAQLGSAMRQFAA